MSKRLSIWIRKANGGQTATDYVVFGMRWPKDICQVSWLAKPENDANKMGTLEVPYELAAERFSAAGIAVMVRGYRAEIKEV